MDRGGHVTDCACMVAMRWLREMIEKSGHVLAAPRNWLGDGHAWYNLPKYLAMYDNFTNFGRT